MPLARKVDSLPDEEKYIEQCFITLIAKKKPALNGGLLINKSRERDNQGLLSLLWALQVFGYDIRDDAA